jgi:hypothetical protein
MRTSTLWPSIKIDGEDLLSGPFGIRFFSSSESERRADQWELDVDRILTNLSKRHSSWAVLRTLSDTRKTILIEPELEQACNSTTYPGDDQDAARTGAAAQHCSKEIEGDNAGTGQGTDCRITFMPSSWAKGGCSAKGAGRDMDEILFHELCHAMRYASGRREDCFDTPEGFKGYEEFVAVTITNVYSSETTRPLRRNHNGFDLLPPTTRLLHKGKPVAVDLHDPCKFCNWFRPQLENIKKYQRPLVDKLSSYRSIKWNPFYYL